VLPAAGARQARATQGQAPNTCIIIVIIITQGQAPNTCIIIRLPAAGARQRKVRIVAYMHLQVTRCVVQPKL
jgi:hypothetical protein